MRGNFIIGLALGAIAGMVILDGSSEAKKVFQKGKKAVTKMADNASNAMESQN